MTAICFNNLSVNVKNRTDGSILSVINGLNLTIESGEFITIFGPNGCGKSTLLNAILEHSSGNGDSIQFFPENPTISYVFQDYRAALFPWLTAYENVCFPLKLNNLKRADIKRRFAQITKDLPFNINWDAYAYQLSGGQAQLVSILRSLVVEPSILLLDEPFSALDYQNSLFMLEWVQELWLKSNLTVIFVSHQIDDAIYLGDKVVLLRPMPTSVAEIVVNKASRPRSLEYIGSEQFSHEKSKALSVFLDIVKKP